MSRIQDIITYELERAVDYATPVMEAQHRNIALLKALDVLVDELVLIELASVRKDKTNEG